MLPNGWTESSKGRIATNVDPVLGGIVDQAIASGEWFVIFNSDHIAPLNGFKSRDDAFAAHAETIGKTFLLAYCK